MEGLNPNSQELEIARKVLTNKYSKEFNIPIEDAQTKFDELLKTPINDFSSSTLSFSEDFKKAINVESDIVDMQVKGKMNGVGSLIDTKYIKINEVKIGEYIVKNVIAIVPTGNGDDGVGSVNDMLIGIGFLKKFKDVEWSLNKNKMRFYK